MNNGRNKFTVHLVKSQDILNAKTITPELFGSIGDLGSGLRMSSKNELLTV